MNPYEIKLGDCLELMRNISDESIDAIITDPPYFLPANHYQTRKQFNRNFSDLSIIEGFYKGVFEQFRRVMKKDGTLYIFCDGQSYPLFYFHLYPFCRSVRPLIWDKKTSINGYTWRHQHELIIFAEMPEANPIPTGDGDILSLNAVKVENRVHPAQKPLELIIKLIEKSTQEGAVILDPFMGSGTVGVACVKCNRNFIGYEIDSGYFEIAKQRIESEVSKPKLDEEKWMKEVD